MPETRVSASAVLGNNVSLGNGVTVMEYAIVHDNAVLEDNVVIGPYSVIGERLGRFYSEGETYRNPPTRIGAGSLIRSHTVIYAGTVLGREFQSGHSAIVREFSEFGDRCLFGGFCQTDEKVRVGNFVRCHSRVFLTGGIEIGDHSLLYPGVSSTDVRYPPYRQGAASPVIGRKCVIGAGSLLLSGIRIGDGAFIAAGSIVTRDIPEATFAMGRPARAVKPVSELEVPGMDPGTAFPFEEERIERWKR